MKGKNNAAALAKNIWHKYNFILIFLAILVVFLVINMGATTMTTLMNIPRHSTVIGIIALGMGLIILTGDIDLSVGSQLALVGGLTVMVFNSTNSILLSLLFAILMGVVLGLINGLLVGAVKMPAFIVTLATMLMYRSIAQTVMNSNNWTIYQLDAGLSQWQPLWVIGNQSVAQIPILVIILAVVVAARLVAERQRHRRSETVGKAGEHVRADAHRLVPHPAGQIRDPAFEGKQRRTFLHGDVAAVPYRHGNGYVRIVIRTDDDLPPAEIVYGAHIRVEVIVWRLPHHHAQDARIQDDLPVDGHAAEVGLPSERHAHQIRHRTRPHPLRDRERADDSGVRDHQSHLYRDGTHDWGLQHLLISVGTHAVP